MRLDFNSFVISGPSTVSLSIAKMLNGVLNAPTGKEVSQKSTCATDSFSVSNSPNIPNLCGTLSGEHGNYLHLLTNLYESKALRHSFYIFE